jgi:hypothetical protein
LLEPPVPEEQYQERFWWRRLDGIGVDIAIKEFPVIELKRTQDARSNYVESKGRNVESFNRNMKTLGILQIKWEPICKKLVRPLLEEQDKVLRSYFAQKGRRRSKGGTGAIARAGNMSKHVYVKTARADRGQVTKS